MEEEEEETEEDEYGADALIHFPKGNKARWRDQSFDKEASEDLTEDETPQRRRTPNPKQVRVLPNPTKLGYTERYKDHKINFMIDGATPVDPSLTLDNWFLNHFVYPSYDPINPPLRDYVKERDLRSAPFVPTEGSFGIVDEESVPIRKFDTEPSDSDSQGLFEIIMGSSYQIIDSDTDEVVSDWLKEDFGGNFLTDDWESGEEDSIEDEDVADVLPGTTRISLHQFEEFLWEDSPSRLVEKENTWIERSSSRSITKDRTRVERMIDQIDANLNSMWIYEVGGGGDCGPLSVAAALVDGQHLQFDISHQQVRRAVADVLGRNGDSGQSWDDEAFEVVARIYGVPVILILKLELEMESVLRIIPSSRMMPRRKS